MRCENYSGHIPLLSTAWFKNIPVGRPAPQDVTRCFVRRQIRPSRYHSHSVRLATDPRVLLATEVARPPTSKISASISTNSRLCETQLMPPIPHEHGERWRHGLEPSELTRSWR